MIMIIFNSYVGLVIQEKEQGREIIVFVNCTRCANGKGEWFVSDEAEANIYCTKCLEEVSEDV